MQMTEEKKCGNCKYLGTWTGEFSYFHDKAQPLHYCENDKSMFVSCIEMATGCDKFENKYKMSDDEKLTPDDVACLISGIDKPKTGHWILDESDNSITCDKCGCRIYANDIGNGDAHYCPNCGMKMGG